MPTTRRITYLTRWLVSDITSHNSFGKSGQSRTPAHSLRNGDARIPSTHHGDFFFRFFPSPNDD